MVKDFLSTTRPANSIYMKSDINKANKEVIRLRKGQQEEALYILGAVAKGQHKER